MKYLMLWGLLLVLIGCTSAQPRSAEPVNTAPNNPNPTSAVNDSTQASAEHGRELFNEKLIGASCSTCHRADSEEKLVGPGMKNVSARASTYKLPQPQSVDDYLRTSILHPDEFVVPGYPPSVMPPNFGKLLSPQDINDLIAYLRTL